MKKAKYNIKVDNVTSDTEETAAVSKISYPIENANIYNMDSNMIEEQIGSLISAKQFPSNLKYIDSYTDQNTGTTTTAFLNKNTGKLIIGMTGTNLNTNAMKRTALMPINSRKASQQDVQDARGSIKDIGADINIARTMVTDKDVHFESTQKFFKYLQKNYEIETITGHSLGGRDAILMGVSNNIKNIVVYNPAPLAIKDFRKYLAFKPRIYDFDNFMLPYRDNYVEKMLERYDGNILKIVSEKDELNSSVKMFEYISAGDELVIKNGKGHSMDGFLDKQEQKEIKKVLRKLQEYKDLNKKTFRNIEKKTKGNLKKIDDIKTNMIQMNGGGLSATQQKLLESVTALTIAKGLSQMVGEEMERINKMYGEMERKFEKNWDEAEEAAGKIADGLSNSEVLEALDAGGANREVFVTIPIRFISDKKTKLANISTRYNMYILKINTSIDEIVSKDRFLSDQIAGLI